MAEGKNSYFQAVLAKRRESVQNAPFSAPDGRLNLLCFTDNLSLDCQPTN